MNTAQPTCYVIAGPNGAGKTTFALDFLPDYVHCRNFVNADMIAAGLSPLAPESMKISAGRLFLAEIHQFVDKRQSFAFETTLSGKTYLRLLKQLLKTGWRIELYYLWLPGIEFSIARVQERVAHGGHDIPVTDIERRYPKSIVNLLQHYAPLCDLLICMDNSRLEPETIFIKQDKQYIIVNPDIYQQLNETCL